MNGFLLDTNVVSEISKPRPDATVAQWIENTDEHLLYLSVLTLGEIRKGISPLPESKRRQSIESWLTEELRLRFAQRILPVDDSIADLWGRISGSAIARGLPMPVIDGLLAATALHHELTLVTRDLEHAERAGAVVLNPWE